MTVAPIRKREAESPEWAAFRRAFLRQRSFCEHRGCVRSPKVVRRRDGAEIGESPYAEGDHVGLCAAHDRPPE